MHQNTADNAINNIIPEALHTYGPTAGKWFTSQALMMYENIKWDPTKKSTTTQTATDTSKILEEDLWGLANTWKARPAAVSGTQDTPVANMSAVGLAINRMNLTSARDVASFGSLFARDKDDDTVATTAPTVPPLPTHDQRTTIVFDAAALPGNAGVPKDTDDNMSMSTAAKTAESTCLRLRETKDTLAHTCAQLDQQTQLFSTFLADFPPELHQKFGLLSSNETADDVTPEDACPPPDSENGSQYEATNKPFPTATPKLTSALKVTTTAHVEGSGPKI
jgi:hypothetical protein